MRRTFLGAAAVVAGLAMLLAAFVALRSAGGPTVGQNVMVNRPAPIDASNSPKITHNPLDDDNLVVSFRIDRPGWNAGVYWTDDGGATWTPTPLRLPADVPGCTGATTQGAQCPYGPDVAFGPDGTLYVLYVNLRGNGNVPNNLWMATSKDGGRTIGAPVRIAGDYTFQPRIAVDPNGPVYVTWLQGFGTGYLSFAEPVPYVVAARTDDGGKTFSPPVRVSDESRARIGGASPVVDREGRLSVLYLDYKENRRDFSNLPGPPAELPFGLIVTTSTDGGKTFSPGREIDDGLIATRRFLIFLPESPQLAVAKDGTLYATWADGRDGDDDVFLRKSSDGGQTWTAPVKVNDNAQDGTAQFLPKVEAAKDGKVHVLFLDGRNDPQNKVLLDAYLATSTDGGKTFKNRRLSDRSFDNRVGPTFGPEYGIDFGTKLGLTSSEGGKVYATWTDTREGNENTGRQDVFYTSVDFGGGGVGTPVMLGAALVLVAGAVAVVGLTRRRKVDSTEPSPSAPEPSVPAR